jgi:hypothetical protein
MVDEQEIVMNLADILAEAYICESLLLRVQKAERKERLRCRSIKRAEKTFTVVFA